MIIDCYCFVKEGNFFLAKLIDLGYDNIMECQKEQNLKNCNCTYPGCDKKGRCCQCVDYHQQRNELPACYFSDEVEKTYDRSIEKFVQN